MGRKWGVVFVPLSYIGVSMAFPFYLVAREHFLARAAYGRPETATVDSPESRAVRGQLSSVSESSLRWTP
ncbi:hypothetical protein [Rhodococcus sp. LB1]|uniref:hypothetical protein n=1 Tax=Rhodococcus sp. LB1 TaxID=1807499 RepID=UPI001E4DBB3A|nr:hypothetical protein [Rhodococcus sp. LB1]